MYFNTSVFMVNMNYNISDLLSQIKVGLNNFLIKAVFIVYWEAH